MRPSGLPPFPRRFYRRPAHLLRDLRGIWRDRRGTRVLMKGEGIDPAFRERLMLAVTEVNGCRYCRYAHARMALTAGLNETEIAKLVSGNLEGSPPEQVPALLYAQHWAETDAQPDPGAREHVVATYGSGQTQAIEAALRAIRVGNLLGNTWDCLLYRVSGGRWGNVRPRRSARDSG